MNRRKPRPKSRLNREEQCPACGYCPHCGQSARPVFIPPLNPYIPYNPVIPGIYPRPAWYPQIWYNGTSTTTGNIGINPYPTISGATSQTITAPTDPTVTAWNSGGVAQSLNFGGSMLSDS